MRCAADPAAGATKRGPYGFQQARARASKRSRDVECRLLSLTEQPGREACRLLRWDQDARRETEPAFEENR